MLNVDWTPSSLSRAYATFEVNWVPLSDIILLGSPYHLQVCSSRILAIPSELMDFLHRVITAVLVNLSVTIWSKLYLFDSGRLVMKSMVIVPNGLSRISIGYKGTMVECVSFLVDWHVVYPSTYWWTVFEILGQVNSCPTVASIPLCPGCPAARLLWFILMIS